MKPAAYNKTTKHLFAYKTRNNLFALAILIIAILCLIATRGHASSDHVVSPEAATIVVNSSSDVANAGDGLCTLREAIMAANGNTASGFVAGECAAGSSSRTDAIDMTGLSGTINLASPLPEIGSDMTITGLGPATLTVRRNNSGLNRIFVIRNGTVKLSGLTIRDGLASSSVLDAQASGGGVYNAGILIMNDVSITSNHATSLKGMAGKGGGVFNSGDLTISNCSITGNTTSENGGGIYNNGTLTMTNCTVFGNTGNFGGGIVNVGSTTLVSTTISNNTGGALYNSRDMVVVNSTINGNTASEGAIANSQNLVITNTTISGNHSNEAVENTSGGALMRLTNCTITANDRNGVYNVSGNGPTSTSRNNIIAGNAGTDITGNWTSLGHNFIGQAPLSSGFTNGTKNDQVGNSGSPINPKLGPLASNGGLTMTHALLAGSPAIDAADNCVTQIAHCGDASIPQLITDQRGVSRLVDGDADTTATVDIGAYETQAPLSSLPDATINEDTQLLVGFDPGNSSTITSVSATSSNSILVPNDAAHLSAAIVGTTGIVTINPASSLFGATNITIMINRTGGGTDSKTIALTVNSVNDAPSFTKGNDQSVSEDAGPQTINSWATDISAGPANESGQTVTLTVSNNNSGLFSSQPAVAPSGSLTYTPAEDANGVATVAVTAKDDGGVANGGTDTSSQTFTINVIAVNDAPSFTKGADQTVNNTAGAQTVANWATGISPGPGNESSQTVTLQVSGNTNPGLFSTAPAVSANGTLTYTPSSSAGGTATISVVAKDTGGNANGGLDTSAPQTFNITVTPVGGFLNFASSTGNTAETSGSVTVNVTRTGNTSSATTVSYATNVDAGVPCSTANGVASPKCDFTAALGTLSFAAGETSKSITILISQDSFVEGPESITLTLSNPTANAALGTTSTMTETINDDVTEPPGNIIDDANMFVRMHYHDFLNREGDQSGIGFWTGQMTSCGNSDLLVCRINVSGAFFLSIEYQQTGYLVERMYKTGYGDAIGVSTIGGSHQIFVPVVRANEFLTDTQRIGRGVVVLQPGWEQLLENNKQAYALEFVQTPRFTIALPTTMTPAQFVDKLNANAGGVLSIPERQAVINLFGGSVNTTNVTARAQALRQVAEDQDLYNFEFSRAFVLTQYIGYLRRNPDDAPEPTLDYTGYDFWLTKLDQFDGDYIKAEMVKAFIASDEYRKRFGP